MNSNPVTKINGETESAFWVEWADESLLSHDKEPTTLDLWFENGDAALLNEKLDEDMPDHNPLDEFRECVRISLRFKDEKSAQEAVKLFTEALKHVTHMQL